MTLQRSSAMCVLFSLVLVCQFPCAPAWAQDWSPPQILNPGQGSGSNTDLAAASGGRFISAWASHGVGSGGDWDIFSASSTDGGANWAAVAPLYPALTDGRTDMVPRVVSAPNGTCVVLWPVFGGGGYDVLVSRSPNFGQNWSVPALLSNTAAVDHEFLPDAATDGKGTWISVWTVGSGAQRFSLSRSENDGVTWSPRTVLNNIPASYGGYGIRAVIATDRAGNWMLVAESDSLTSPTTGPDWDLLCFVSKDNGFTWSQPRPVNNWAMADDNNDAVPSLAADGNGTWAAVWQSQNAFGGAPHQGNIFVSVSTDMGDNWTTPARVNSVPGSSALGNTLPRISTDGKGTWGVAWEYANFQQPGQIVFAKSTDNCATWSEKQVLGTADYQYEAPGLATDGQGNWGVNWWLSERDAWFSHVFIALPTQTRASGWDIYQ